MKKTAVLLTVLLASLLVSSAFAQAFDSASDASGEGYDWNHTTLTLTLSGNASFDSLELPDGAKITIPAGKTLTDDASANAGTIAIHCSGALTIEGGGKLAVKAAEASGLTAQYLTASGIDAADAIAPLCPPLLCPKPVTTADWYCGLA